MGVLHHSKSVYVEIRYVKSACVKYAWMWRRDGRGVGQPVHTDMCTNEDDGRMNGGEDANGIAVTEARCAAVIPAGSAAAGDKV